MGIDEKRKWKIVLKLWSLSFEKVNYIAIQICNILNSSDKHNPLLVEIEILNFQIR